MPRAVAGVALVAAGALALAGCGVPIGGAHALPRSGIPSALLQRQLPPQTTTPTTTPTGDYVLATIFWVGPGGTSLVPAQRWVPGTAPLRSALDDLTTGPLPSETSQGDSSALDPNVRLAADPTPNGQVVTVDFTSPFGLISGPEQVLAVAQVVYTVAASEGCGIGVAFEIDGTAAAVPIYNGAETLGPVSQSDYAALKPSNWSCPPTPPTPPTTTTTTTTRPTRPTGG